MALLKQANAMVIHPRVSGRGWDKIRKAATEEAPPADLTAKAREILGGSLDPDQYLFTHCTIVASVDVEVVPGIKTGKVRVGSKTIDRRFADYHILPASTQYVNNNGDSWSRGVLKKSYHTFIGGHNFQEHVQIEEKSKGRILDAVSRDIGDSLYIDILVATNRKHTTLVRDILSQDMSTLSMGCTTDFTICSKCGHVAADETELCDCIRYEKLNTFIDDEGKKRVVAELCGHESVGDTGAVHFIEASWVGTPAFPGAVLRNIMALGDTARAESEIRRILASPAPAAYWSDSAMKKAASSSRLVFSGFEDDVSEEPAPPAAEKPAAVPFQDLEDSVYKSISDRVRQRIQKDLEPKVTDVPTPTDAPNDTVIKQAALAAQRALVATGDAYKRSMLAACHAASSDAALINAAAEINAAFGVVIDPVLYRVALSVGPITDHSQYIAACKKHAKRELSRSDLRVMVRLSSLLTQWACRNPLKSRSPQE